MRLFVGDARVEPFETAVERFKKFLVQQHYPPNLLWLRPEDVVFWCLRYYFRKSDPSDDVALAKAEFESAIARNVGVALQAECKTVRWSLCRVYVPEDDLDAERRMIPKTGVKISATADPKPAIEVCGRIQWRLLKWLVRKSPPCWS